jgi:hypothetical protein
MTSNASLTADTYISPELGCGSQRSCPGLSVGSGEETDRSIRFGRSVDVTAVDCQSHPEYSR